MDSNMILIIDRKRWLRGEGEEVSSLLRRYDNKMCCLGFLCLAIGFSPTQITGIASPARLLRHGSYPEKTETFAQLKLTEYLGQVLSNTDSCIWLMKANDSKSISEDQ